MRIPYIMPPSIFSYTGDRDAKCHGYGGYICVKKIGKLGQQIWEVKMAKSCTFGKICTTN